jgi:hypothetical protein
VAALAVNGEWANMGADFDKAWGTVGPRVTVLVTAAQRGAARDGADYVPRLLDETDQTAPLAATPNLDALAGVASDGRPLDSLLYGGVVEAKHAVAGGATPAEGLAQGGRWLGMVTTSQIIDAATMAQSVSRVARPAITGYVRVLNGASCSRCAILAGRWYRYNASFDRHPRCDCDGVETTERFDKARVVNEAKATVKALGTDGITDLTIAERKALDAGADLQSVVNAKKTGTFGTLSHTRVEDIYATASNRDEAIALLQHHGFLTTP